MRGIQLSFSNTQKLRLEKALAQLESLSSKLNSNATVIVADKIPVDEDAALKGHGTLEMGNDVVASVCGVVERVNKLVYVRPLRARYKPEIGDIIVGRVIEVSLWFPAMSFLSSLLLSCLGVLFAAGSYVSFFQGHEFKAWNNFFSIYYSFLTLPNPGSTLFTVHLAKCKSLLMYPQVAPKRWRLEINFSQDAVLMLSSMNLPDGIQRRRTAVDELNMRSIFVENDVICAEVRGFQHDGSLHLQARSQKYGKLERGKLLKIPPYLVKRRKQHFHHLDQYGVDLIFGCNGLIWVGEHVDVKDAMVEDQVNKSDPQNTHSSSLPGSSEEPTDTPLERRQYICRIANAITVFSALGFMVNLDSVMETVTLSLSLNLGVHEMLEAEFHVRVAEQEAERRSTSKRRK
ncbi:hypothetical protein MTR67_040894 [Solanum verrucosum]|uniref:Uncharacterized protein n=1 Tax=Solanum verrucosum TaxID=315347 RepID=A0AAF0ZSK3_SOLVR|nr:hypothetical protein MTR67_040894 [Solanum verrucosum]